MGLFSLEKLFGITIRESATDGSDFTNPDADYRRLFLGEDGQLHVKDSAGAVTDIGTGGGATLTSFDSKLSGNVTMTTGATYYDGPNSGSLAAGTWMVWWKVLFEFQGTTAAKQYLAKLWDGSTTYDEGETDMMGAVAGYGVALSGFALVVLGSPATLKISATSASNGQIMLRDSATLSGAAANPGNTHTPTRIAGIKIA